MLLNVKQIFAGMVTALDAAIGEVVEGLQGMLMKLHSR